MTHSPLPWKLIEIQPEPYQHFRIDSANGGVVIGDDDDRGHKDFNDDDLRLAVTAVNAHAELARVLELVKPWTAGMTANGKSINAEINAALKLARGESSCWFVGITNNPATFRRRGFV